MKRLVLFCLGAAALASSGLAQSVWLEETFDTPNSRWFVPRSSDWTLTGTELRCVTGGYDQLLAAKFYASGTTPYSFEVRMKGARAGIYFHLDDTASKAFSHMVRFDDKSILTGYFNGAGEYHATNTFESPVSPEEWLTLRIDIDPLQGRYGVSVNGTQLGVDTVMMFRSGYLGLQASDGISEFKSVRAFASSSQVPRSRTQVGEEIAFQHVRFVQSDGEGVTIYDPEAGFYQMLDAKGRLKRQEISPSPPKLRSEAVVGSYTFSIERHVIIARDRKGAVVDSIVDRVSAPGAVLAGKIKGKPVLYVSDPGLNAVLAFDERCNLLKTFQASSMGGFRGPLGIDHYGKDELVIADFDRLVFVKNSLDEVEPSIRFVTPTEAEITWDRTSDSPARLDFVQTVGVKNFVSKDRTRNGARVTGLKPLTRYAFNIAPVLRTIPSSASYSRLFRMSSPPSDSAMMAYTKLPLMYMVYRTISYRDKYPKDKFPNIPDGRTLTDSEIDYLRQATAFNRDFFFRNSACRVLLDFDFAVVEDTLWLHEVGDQDPYWLSPNDRVARDFEREAAGFGKSPGQYAGLLCPYAWVNYPPRRKDPHDPIVTDSIKIRQAYGGGTYGVPAPWRYGKTAGYTGNPFQDAFSRQDWLITHEFHHQIDALMEASGFAEYYHSDLPWKMPGRFGEDFDFNAHIIRLAPHEWWLNLAFGSLEQARDEDHDGVPDNEPSLPFDEKRLNGNPRTRDTDGDGLSDLEEVMAGTSLGTKLDKKDTDGDGVPDGSDPEPLYAFNGPISKGSPTTLVGSVRESDLAADVYAGWDESFFYVHYEADRPANILIQIDADADGWFHGFDNIQTRVLAYEDSVSVAGFYLRDCASWIQSPKDRRDILKTSDLIVELKKPGQTSVRKPTARGGRGVVARMPGRTWTFAAKIPRMPSYGFDLRPGKKMGLRIGLQTATDLWVWHELFERNYMMEVELR